MILALIILVAILAVVTCWLAVELARAPQGCDDCQGVTDCPQCGPITRRVS